MILFYLLVEPEFGPGFLLGLSVDGGVVIIGVGLSIVMDGTLGFAFFVFIYMCLYVLVAANI